TALLQVRRPALDGLQQCGPRAARLDRILDGRGRSHVVAIHELDTGWHARPTSVRREPPHPGDAEGQGALTAPEVGLWTVFVVHTFDDVLHEQPLARQECQFACDAPDDLRPRRQGQVQL